MKSERYLYLLLILLVLMFSISAVSAADDAATDIINSDNDQEIILDENDDFIDEKDDGPSLGNAYDGAKLKDGDIGSFTELNNTINGNDDIVINLTKSYTFNGTSDDDSNFIQGIVINRTLTINGNGHTIDGAKTARIFFVNAEDVTIKNITFTNGYVLSKEFWYDSYGGAICWNASGGTIENSTFTKNTAYDGGAICWCADNGTVVNSTFSLNNANGGSGGAICWNASGGTIENSTFTKNTAYNGGAIFWFADNGTVANSTFTQNNATIYGGAIYWNNAIGGTIENSTFSLNNANGGSGGAIFWFADNGTVVNSTFSLNNANGGRGGAIFWGADNGTVVNSTFSLNTATLDGGAIRWGADNGTVVNSTFSLNTATWDGGAISWFADNGTVVNSTFSLNTANKGSGGAIFWMVDGDGKIKNNIFLNNNKTIYLEYPRTCNMSYNWFGNNVTNYTVRPDIDEAIILNDWLFLNGTAPSELDVLSSAEIIFKLSSYDNENGNIDDEYDNSLLPIVNMSISTTNGNIKKNATFNESITYSPSSSGPASVTARFDGADCTIAFDIVKADSGLNVAVVPKEISYGENAIVKLKFNPAATGKVNITLTGKENSYEFKDFDLTETIVIPDLIMPDEYAVSVSYSGDGNFFNVKKTAEDKLTLNKIVTELTANNITATYKKDNCLVVSLKDADGNAISGASVFVDINGAKEYTTNENGQLEVAVGSLVPSTYDVKISFAGDSKYMGSDINATVTVKKATPKLTAKAKSFKFEDKTKKYTITLKDNNGKVLKNTKVTLKVNGKTYTATTNSKGVATFKLSKLTKKGTYNAVITYAGDKYYNKLTKKVKITVKVPAWKNVAKGSKDKGTVKKIQKALKKNGFYLKTNGHYLKVDGVYDKYTVMAVKQFQKAKGLKVTGKVDYATAKKLKIVS